MAILQYLKDIEMLPNQTCVVFLLHCSKPHPESKRDRESKKPVIKKPLNAFMLYMKEMRAKVIAECTLKESAAINQILGRRVRVLLKLCWTINKTPVLKSMEIV